jgi:hypothetical protein
MKIHYLATANIPSKSANSLQIVKVCEAMSKLGHDVSLFVPNLITLDTSITKYYGLNSKFKVIKVGKKLNYLSKKDNLILPFKFFFKSLFLRKDLLITRNIILSLIFFVFRINHTLELHDDLESTGKFISKIFVKFRILNSKKIKLIFITKNLKDFIRKKYFFSNNKFKILHDASDIRSIEKIKCQKKLKLNVGYFGSIYSSRGIITIKKLSKLDQNNKYFIFGGSKKELEKDPRYKNTQNLFFNKQIPYKNVKKEILKMDVLLMPYTDKATISGDYGNIINFMSPMKMFDYLGSGKIILSADIKVLREVLKNNYNSILIKNYNNVYAWKKEIDKIKFNKNKYFIIRKNALKTANKYTWKKRVEEIINL